MRYLVIVSTMMVVSCTNTDIINDECQEILGPQYLESKHQIKQRNQAITKATQVEEAARNKCDEAIRVYNNAVTKVDFKPACRRERNANISLQSKIEKLRGAYLNAYSELNAYNPKCTNNEQERTAAASLRESYKQKRNDELIKIDDLKKRHQYLVGQFVTLK